MNCEELRTAIQEALDGGQLPEGVEEHLAGCEGCRAFRESLREADALLASDPILPWTPEMTGEVLARVGRDRRARWWSGVAAAAVLLMAAWLGVELVPVPAALGSVSDQVAARVSLPGTPAEAIDRFAASATGLFDSAVRSLDGVPFSAGLPVAAIAILALLALNAVVAGRLRLAGRQS